MKCPICNSNVTGNTCRSCGLNMSLFGGLSAASLVLYNLGLETANRGELSDAIQCLTKSLELDRRNTASRNLLGLCYYGMGKISDALREWVISTSYDKNDNMADYYLDVLQSSQREVDRCDEGIRKYNHALVTLRQKSDDIAIIHLKKAVEYNPRFLDALNLLALCYIKMKDRAKAAEYIDRVLQIDKNNRTALTYFKELFPSYPSAAAVPRRTLGGGGASAFVPKIDRQLKQTLPVSQLLCFLVGALCVLSVVYVLILPQKTADYESEIAQLKAEAVRQKTAYDSDMLIKDGQIAELGEQVRELSANYAEARTELEVQSRVQKINIANQYLLQNRGEDALNYLDTIQTEGLPDDALALYNSIKETAYPLVETDYYNRGVKDYNAKAYGSAQLLFENCLKYASSWGDSKIQGDANYFLGRIAEIANDKALARIYYENVVNNFKNAGYYNTASTRLANLR